jgi:hypothetical protein
LQWLQPAALTAPAGNDGTSRAGGGMSAQRVPDGGLQLMGRVTNAARVLCARARLQPGLFGLPPFPAQLTIPLSAALGRSGTVWYVASAVVFAIIVAPVVQQKIRKQAHATPTFDMSRYDTVVYRDAEQIAQSGSAPHGTFDERWGATAAFALPGQDLANPIETVRAAKMNYLPDELVFAPRVGAGKSTTRFSLASADPAQAIAVREELAESTALPKGPALGTMTDDPAAQKTVAKMDEVERYLWEAYKRAPVKEDKAGDFTWKDPAAAKRFGVSMPAYVISGMDPDFREQLYHMGKAMDAEGIKWAILSAFRDDYRQSLASGYKASARNSLHGGSRRTGGYGHGRAVDVTEADGEAGVVWEWIDKHGAKYGLHRPMKKGDPVHVQSTGDWRKLARSLRQGRIKLAKTRAPDESAAAKSKVVANASQ